MANVDRHTVGYRLAVSIRGRDYVHPAAQPLPLKHLRNQNLIPNGVSRIFSRRFAGQAAGNLRRQRNSLFEAGAALLFTFARDPCEVIVWARAKPEKRTPERISGTPPVIGPSIWKQAVQRAIRLWRWSTQ